MSSVHVARQGFITKDPLPNISRLRGGVGPEPYARETVLLLNGDGTNGAQNNSFIGETFQPDQYAVSFDGSGDFLRTPAGSAFAYGTGTYTVECWVNLSSYSADPRIFAQTVSGNEYFTLWVNSSGKIVHGANASGFANNITGATTVPLNSWFHIALVREGTGSNQTKIYLNGVLDATGTASADFTNTTYVPTIGRYTHAASSHVTGYISNLRIVKGTALYTSNFTPPTGPLTAITNTSLLTCQSPTIVDNSSNAFTITANGDATAINTSTLYPTITRNGNTTQGTFSPFLVTNDKFSSYFDGSGDFLTTPTNTSAFNLTADFTVEFWFNPSVMQLSGLLANGVSTFDPSGVAFVLNHSTGINKVSFFARNISSVSILQSNTVLINEWTHLAMVRSGSTITLYQNGVSVGTYTSSSTIALSTTLLNIGTYWNGGFSGYISNLRIVNGTAVYTSNFAPSTVPLTAIPNTVLLACQSNTFKDNSSNNFAITRNGDVRNTTFNPFEPNGDVWSNFFDGTGDYLTVPDNDAFHLGSNDWTIDLWANFANVSGEKGLVSHFTSTFPSEGFIFRLSANNSPSGLRLLCSSNNTSVILQAAWAPVIGTWYHIAAVRDGGTLRIYVDGVQIGSTSIAITIGNPATTFAVGTAQTVASSDMNGYISNVRLVKGTCLYTGGTTFTPPTLPLTAVSGTSLLTCQSNRFADASINNFAITRNGDVRVTPFSPFQPTRVYSPTVNGGSGYFDGTGDYLSAPDDAALEVPTQDFTIECWVYFNVLPSSGGAQVFAQKGGTLSGSNYEYGFRIFNSSGSIILQTQWSTNGTSVSSLNSTAGLITANQWYHVALTRSGTNATIWLNGVAVGNTSSYASTLHTGNSALFIGANNTGDNRLNGYMSNLRFVKGTAVYTSAFTPPTAPLTAITNTSLLLNFTNAGIIDSTGKNVLETVDNAQIDTAVKKYGTGSMEFDGTGDYLQIPTNPDLDFDGGNWTVEMWINFNVSNPTNIFLWHPVNHVSGFRRLSCYISNVGQPAIAWFGTVVTTSSGLSWNAGQWYHLAFVRNGNTWTIYRDGISVSSATNTNTLQAASGYVVANPLNGYIDDLRVTKGIARYTSNFTPPTAPLVTYGGILVSNSTYGVYQLA